ncbi:hypothetical protein J2X69_004898 [Algoriphagus sp. 4150]|uniref:RagB/SusD family nutrient uptake outer membrane protein n=1 Tax=Algoriphagus sp. 4150 TaxID=2817756 RepID=UPI002860B4F9|nr:RagB/SusD family nutrient uptake outer membrane protein [Algoriphagus sp. 4150]MDR7132526.1 hypothetical protein [Algoriphagus sp. 4150]
MKNHNKLLILLVGFTLSYSCVSLDEKPESNLTSNQFYRTSEDAVAAVNAIYHRMFTEWLVLFNRQLMMFEMATDDVVAGPRTRSTQVIDLSSLNHVPANTGVEWSWQYTYDAINRANIAIEKIPLIPETEINPELRNRLIAEARLLRAWNYFNLVRWFGAVPLVLKESTALTEESLNVTNASEEAIYSQILEDLQAAEGLPAPGSYSSNEVGRATLGTQKALMAKVHLTRQNWSEAASTLKELIDSDWYQLYDDFNKVFDPAFKNGPEHIFSIQFNGDPAVTNGVAWYSMPFEFNGEFVDAPNLGGGLYESFESGDKRKDRTLAKEITNPQTGLKVLLQNLTYVKYFDSATPFNQQQSRVNIPLLRYADVLLMYAEALNELNGPSAEAQEYLNRVRIRAGIPEIAQLGNSLSKDGFREYVFEERRKELALEYHRWFDLSRRGPDYYVSKLKSAGKSNAAPRHVKFPIPLRELQLNPNLSQSPDWAGF